MTVDSTHIIAVIFFLQSICVWLEDQVVSDTQKTRVDACAIDSDLFIALIYDEEQYSIWSAKKKSRPVGKMSASADRNPKYPPISMSTGPICDRRASGERWIANQTLISGTDLKPQS